MVQCRYLALSSGNGIDRVVVYTTHMVCRIFNVVVECDYLSAALLCVTEMISLMERSIILCYCRTNVLFALYHTKDWLSRAYNSMLFISPTFCTQIKKYAIYERFWITNLTFPNSCVIKRSMFGSLA